LRSEGNLDYLDTLVTHAYATEAVVVVERLVRTKYRPTFANWSLEEYYQPPFKKSSLTIRP